MFKVEWIEQNGVEWIHMERKKKKEILMYGNENNKNENKISSEYRPNEPCKQFHQNEILDLGAVYRTLLFMIKRPNISTFFKNRE